ncbi:NUP50 nucleoporin [Nitzschia inconspicua]|uniref:NUP50 nucleoporin n=1 Tax=Nitzschia inconspicua TaxID=303405 RepID=A0A9K3KGB9_9STRA|nr:NUP50 nucleoporin [Nitzschia inconspicua]
MSEADADETTTNELVTVATDDDPSRASEATTKDEGVTSLDGETGCDATAAASSTSGNPLVKNKRTADRQITKDDYDGDDDEDVDEIKHGFKRASAEVMATRKIVRVKRPGLSTSTSSSNNTFSANDPNGTTEKDDGDSKPSNPFASVSLRSSTMNSINSSKSTTVKATPTEDSTSQFKATTLTASSTQKEGSLVEKKEGDTEKEEGTNIGNDSGTSKPKVFGSLSAFSGFKTAASGNGFGSGFTGFSAFGKSSGNNSLDGGNSTTIFGAATAGTGFPKTSPSNLFGSSTSSTGFSSTSSLPLQGPSLFQTGAGAPTFSFSAYSKKSEDGKSDDGADDANEEEEVDVTLGGVTPVVNLPEQVQLTTGEEGEEVIHDGRCKSFHWVPNLPEKEDASDSKLGVPSNPSVKPSKAFQTAFSTLNSDIQDSSNIDNKEGDASKNGELTADGAEKNEKTKSEVSASKSADADTTFKWQELGVGPMKILNSTSVEGKCRLVQRRESTPNGNATKVILNVPLWKESTAEMTAPRYLTLRTLVDSKVECYSFRFKDSSDASFFHHYLKQSISNAKAAFSATD